MASKILLKRNTLANIGTLDTGEPYLATDTFDLYLGTSAGNKQFSGVVALDTRYLQISAAATTYVPYTGGMASLDLSGYGVTADDLVANDLAYFPTGTRIQSGIDTDAILDATLITSSDKTFTFPNATGTFALQSAITDDFVVGAETLHFTNGILTLVT